MVDSNKDKKINMKQLEDKLRALFDKNGNKVDPNKDKISKTLVHLYSLGYNNYTYTEGDPVLYDNQLIWNTYENFKLIETLDASRKEKWGMIYFKI